MTGKRCAHDGYVVSGCPDCVEPLIRTPESLDEFLEAGLRELDAEQAAQELMARVPAIRVAIEKIRMAQKISRALLNREITI